MRAPVLCCGDDTLNAPLALLAAALESFGGSYIVGAVAQVGDGARLVTINDDG